MEKICESFKERKGDMKNAREIEREKHEDWKVFLSEIINMSINNFVSKQCEKIINKKMKIQKETRAKIKILCLELQMIKVFDEKKAQ